MVKLSLRVDSKLELRAKYGEAKKMLARHGEKFALAIMAILAISPTSPISPCKKLHEILEAVESFKIFLVLK